jgi:hypothetical protein
MSDALQPVIPLFIIAVSFKTPHLDVRQFFHCFNKLLNIYWKNPLLKQVDTNISELVTSIFRTKDSGVKLTASPYETLVSTYTK